MVTGCTKVIDDHTYEFTQFTATKSWNLLARLSKIVGESISVLIAAGEKEKLTQDIAQQVAKSLVTNLDVAESDALIKEYMTCVRFEGQPIQFDTHFAGKLGHMFKVLYAALEVQYGDFFGAIGVLGVQNVAPIKAKA